MSKFKPTEDQNFNAFSERFNRNIYASTKGKLRLDLLQHDLTEFGLTTSQCQVLDAGCGAGQMSIWLAQYANKVCAIEISQNLLETAQQTAIASDLHINFMHVSIQDYCQQQPEPCFDWIICHAVVEWLAEPHAVIKQLTALLKPGGKLSIMFFNKTAQLFGNLLYGNFDYVAAGMRVKREVRLNPKNPLEPAMVYSWLEQDYTILRKRGIRCFHDYLFDRKMQQSHYQQIFENELKYSLLQPFVELGKYVHVIAEKKS